MRFLLPLVALIALTLPSQAMAKRASVGTHSSGFGTILTDGKGYALYIFTKDGRGPSACYGSCAKAWPPLLTTGKPKAVGGARQSLLGTTRRRDGRRQVTYRGRPVYYYVGDNGPGVVKCQNVFEFGGTWLILRPNGKVVR